MMEIEAKSFLGCVVCFILDSNFLGGNSIVYIVGVSNLLVEGHSRMKPLLILLFYTVERLFQWIKDLG